MSQTFIVICIKVTNFVLISQIEKDHSMIFVLLHLGREFL